MEDIDINIPEESFANDFTIIYKGQEEREGHTIELIEEIKTSKEELIRKLRYFRAKNNEIKYLNEIFIHEKYPIKIFRDFINTIKTKHIKVNDNNYQTLYELSSKYEYEELKEQIKIFSQTRPDMNNLINKYKFEKIDSNKEENISMHLDVCLKNKNFLKFPITVLNRILNSPKRVLNDHHLLFNFIKQIINNSKTQNDEEIENLEILIGSLDYSEMSNEEIDEFFNEFNFSNIFNSRHSKEKMKEMNEERKKLQSTIFNFEEKIKEIENKAKESQEKNFSQINELMDQRFGQFERIILSIQNENKNLHEIIQKQQSEIQKIEQKILNIQNENKNLKEIIQKQELKTKNLEQQENAISNIQNENKNLKEIIQKQELKIQKLEQQGHAISNIQNESENLKEIIQKQELKIKELEQMRQIFEKTRECEITGEISAQVENNEIIKGTINLHCINSSNLDKTKSKFIIHSDSSSSINENSFEKGFLIESL